MSDPHHALQRNFDLCFPRKGTARPQSHFHIHVSVSDFLYSNDRSSYFPAAEYVDRPWEYINRTQKHENRNWDCGRAVPFLEIYVSNFRTVSLQLIRLFLLRCGPGSGSDFSLLNGVSLPRSLWSGTGSDFSLWCGFGSSFKVYETATAFRPPSLHCRLPCTYKTNFP